MEKKIKQYESIGYKVSKTDDLAWCTTVHMKKIVGSFPNRDPFGNATEGGHERIAYVEITEYPDGEIEVNRF